MGGCRNDYSTIRSIGSPTTQSPRITEQLRRVLLDAGHLLCQSPLLVAVSGGADSLTLLHILHGLQADLGIALHVATLDHGLRGQRGVQDAAYVQNIAQQWGLPCSRSRVEVQQLARLWGLGIEAAARRARYDFLARIAREQGCRAVAVGHHALDQAETILLHILRGSGTQGLAGMRARAPMPHHPSLTLLRPLLKVHPEQIAQYCAAQGIQAHHDETNDKRSYRRNYLRHEVMGRLQALNPQLLAAFQRLADNAAVDMQFIDAELERQLLQATQQWQHGWRIQQRQLFAAHPALQRRWLRRAFHALAAGRGELSQALTTESLVWARAARSGSRRDLGAGLMLQRCYNELLVLRAGGTVPYPAFRLLPAGYNERLALDEPLCRFDLQITLQRAQTQGAPTALDGGTMLRLRGRAPGDRFRAPGMGGHSRKLKAWMIDRKIPRDIRPRIPLICDEHEVLAICTADGWLRCHPAQWERRGLTAQLQ